MVSEDGGEHVLAILARAKELAREYRSVTGKPLGVTGEVAEYEAAVRLGIELAPARTAGYDAVERLDGRSRRLQIKGRCLQDDSKPSQRLGRIRLDKPWDAVLMVVLDRDLNAVEIWEAERDAIEVALTAPGSKARNERGALSLSKFRAIGRKRWPL